MTEAARNVTNLDLDLIRTFVAICETGNFSRAAARVYRSPSAVSVQMARLEDVLGRTLFIRHTRTVALTADGDRLLGPARRMLGLNDAVVSDFTAPRMEGRVRFGAPNDSGVLALPNMLQRFAATHPNVEVEVRLDTSRALARICEAGELDIVLFTAREPPGRDAIVVHSETLVWVGLRGGTAIKRRPLPLALCDNGCSWRATALDALERAALPYRIAYTSEHCQGQLAAIEADLAIGALPASAARGSFMRLLEDMPPLGGYDVFMKIRPSAGPATKALGTHITDSFRETAGQGIRLFA